MVATIACLWFMFMDAIVSQRHCTFVKMANSVDVCIILMPKTTSSIYFGMKAKNDVPTSDVLEKLVCKMCNTGSRYLQSNKISTNFRTHLKATIL